MSKQLWLKNVNILDVRSGEILAAQNVLIEGGKITRISKDAPGGEFVADCTGLYLTPGLMDMHVHITLPATANPIGDSISAGNGLSILYGADNAYRSLKRGVTLVRDVGCVNNTSLPLREGIRKGLIPGCEIRTSGTALECTYGHHEEFGIICDTAEERIKAIRRQKLNGVDLIKVMASPGGGDPKSMNIVLYSTDELRVIVEESHHLGLKVSPHALGRGIVESCVEAGIDSVEHGGAVSYDTLKKMKEKGIFYVPTLAVYHSMANDETMPAVLQLKSQRIVEEQKETFRNAMELGVKIALGTDCSGPNFTPHPAVQYEMRIMHEYGMENLDVIRSATLMAAELIDETESLGTVEVGKTADLLLLNGNPLEDLSVFDKGIVQVYKAGDPVL